MWELGTFRKWNYAWDTCRVGERSEVTTRLSSADCTPTVCLAPCKVQTAQRSVLPQSQQLTIFPYYLFILPHDLNMKHICDIPLLGFFGRFNVSVVAQSLSCVQLCNPMGCSTPGFPVFHFPVFSPRVCSNSSALNHWCHPTISFSVAPFSSCPQSFPSSGFFQWVGS